VLISDEAECDKWGRWSVCQSLLVSLQGVIRRPEWSFGRLMRRRCRVKLDIVCRGGGDGSKRWKSGHDEPVITYLSSFWHPPLPTLGILELTWTLSDYLALLRFSANHVSFFLSVCRSTPCSLSLAQKKQMAGATRRCRVNPEGFVRVDTFLRHVLFWHLSCVTRYQCSCAWLSDISCFYTGIMLVSSQQVLRRNTTHLVTI
jgi:hypothetical protein